jgi:hypothetical protein
MKETEYANMYNPMQTVVLFFVSGQEAQMPFHDDKHFLQAIETIETDTEAEAYLPPYLIARKSYAGFRAEGASPRAALRQTLELWREFQQGARPASYGKIRQA